MPKMIWSLNIIHAPFQATFFRSLTPKSPIKSLLMCTFDREHLVVLKSVQEKFHRKKEIQGLNFKRKF